ncbi:MULTISPECIES: C39 family peptidase [unclassified Gemella]|uniref:C39 family peptidase n=1 Tax=unclassified Gemella TaxID=2624949 RepID=UPI001C040DD1|nr:MULTISPECIES: C39 family peptidase [unclassified Gemella]MBU0279255.1 C39 family peptidase [Gemella sp. zg-1178]QWQ38760.1 C39 family peptidase [Gemella sp. zg-570]
MKKYLSLILILIFCLGCFFIIKNKFYSKNISSNNISTDMSDKNKKKDREASSEKLKNEDKIENKTDKTSETKSPEIPNYTVVDGVKIGKKFVLDVNQQIQKEWYYCAPTTVSMILSAKDKDVDQYTLAKEMGTYEPFGTHNKDAIRILNKYMFGYEYPADNQSGYRLESVSLVNEEVLATFKKRLKKNIEDGYPMYYTFDMSKVYEGRQGEHNVVGIGYALTPDESDIALLYYIDPSYKVQDATYGGLKVITPEQLLTAMLTCEEPNYAW